MPKIIHNIEEVIEKNAITLFNKYDYNNVDMKMIAKHSNIAVGTLYNYYPNKKQLFITAALKSWSATANALDAIYDAPLTPEEKLSQSIEVLYDDIEVRKGMGQYIYSIFSKYEFEGEVVDIFHTLFFKIERLFQPFEKKSFSCSEDTLNLRLSKSLITTLQSAIVSFPHDRENNLHFVQNFFYNSLHYNENLKNTKK